MPLSRRTFNAAVASIATAALLPRSTRARPATQPAARPWLLFTKSADFEHHVIKRPDGRPSFLHTHLAPVFAARGLSLIESKDGRLFDPPRIDDFAGFVFYTTGDLATPGTDGQPPMTRDGMQALADAMLVRGVPMIGLHCASDTFHSTPDRPSWFLDQLGGEFEAHGDQQRATARIVDDSFPGVGHADDWSFVEEWYAFKSQRADVRPIHVLETAGMHGRMYERKPYPITWTMNEQRSRVFYTAIGHREDVIAGKPWQTLIGGAIEWCTRPDPPTTAP